MSSLPINSDSLWTSFYDGYKTPAAPESTDLEVDKLLSSQATVRDCIETIARTAGKVLAEKPYIIPYYDGEIPDDSGVSGIGLVSDGGHIIIHTFDHPKKRTAFADVLLFDEANNLNVDTEESFAQLLNQRFQFDRLDRFNRSNSKYNEELPKSFGPHFMGKAPVPEGFTLNDMYDLIAEIPPTIGMTPIAIPRAYRINEGKGLAGIGVIAESHISVYIPYLNPNEGTANTAFLDIFSCKDFDIEAARELFAQHGFTIDDPKLIARGLAFPNYDKQ